MWQIFDFLGIFNFFINLLKLFELFGVTKKGQTCSRINVLLPNRLASWYPQDRPITPAPITITSKSAAVPLLGKSISLKKSKKAFVGEKCERDIFVFIYWYYLFLAIASYIFCQNNKITSAVFAKNVVLIENPRKSESQLPK